MVQLFPLFLWAIAGMVVARDGARVARARAKARAKAREKERERASGTDFHDKTTAHFLRLETSGVLQIATAITPLGGVKRTIVLR